MSLLIKQTLVDDLGLSAPLQRRESRKHIRAALEEVAKRHITYFDAI